MPRFTYSLSPVSNGSSMPSPTDTPARLGGALVGGLHDAGAAAGDGRVAGLGQPAPSSTAAAYIGWSVGVRAEPNTLTAGPTSARVPKPSTNSDWMRMTRHGSECTQSVSPRLSSSRWSVVVDCTWSCRRITGPWWRVPRRLPLSLPTPAA